MNTWTFRAAAVALLFGAATFWSSAHLAVWLATADPDARPDVSLPEARLADGALAVVPPDGFCLDRRMLADDFAVLARCDSLGGRVPETPPPLGLLTVSVMAAEAVEALSDLVVMALPAGSAVQARRETEGLALVQVAGAPVPRGADQLHWRGLGQIGPHLVSVAAYAPDGGSLADGRGADALTALVGQSRAASLSEGHAAELGSKLWFRVRTQIDRALDSAGL